MLRVGVVGAGGRMGRTVCAAVVQADDLELVGAVDPAAAGTELAALDPSLPPVVVSADLDGLEAVETQVVVDFTTTSGIGDRLVWYAEHGLHAVVGTTGIGPSDLERARLAFEQSSANAVVAPNFAIGAALLMAFCELAAPVMDGVEIIELHHDAKVDAPSGTALATAERIAAARSAAGSGPFHPDPTTTVVLEGARGGLGSEGIRVHSVRLAGLVAHEEVIFGALGQSLSVRHDSYDRVSFMPGVLLAVRRVSDLDGLTVGLGALLGL
jgi:4-hydroxy-tetrahydrodipicolinate reductase